MKYLSIILAFFLFVACKSKKNSVVSVPRKYVSGQVLCIVKDTGIFTVYRYTPFIPPWNGKYDTTYMEDDGVTVAGSISWGDFGDTTLPVQQEMGHNYDGYQKTENVGSPFHFRIGPGDQDTTVRHIRRGYDSTKFKKYLHQIGGNDVEGLLPVVHGILSKKAFDILINGESGVSDSIYIIDTIRLRGTGEDPVMDTAWKDIPGGFPTRDTAFREVDFEGDHYRILYAYDPRRIYNPLVAYPLDSNGNEPDQSHFFDCIITVLVKNNFNYVPIGYPIGGTYVPGGCFEDIPLFWVQMAIKAEKAKHSLGTGRAQEFRFLPGIVSGPLYEDRDSFLVSTRAESFYIGNTYENISSQRISNYNGINIESLSHEQRDSLLATLPSLEQLDSMWREADSLINEGKRRHKQYQNDSTIGASLIILTGYREDTIRNIDHITVRGFIGKKTLYHVPGLIKVSWYGQKKEQYYYLNGVTRCPLIKIFYKQ